MKLKIIFYLSLGISIYVFFNLFKGDGEITYSWITSDHLEESARVLEPVLPEMESYFFENHEEYPKSLNDIGFSHLKKISNNKYVSSVFIKHRALYVQLKDPNSDNKTSFSLRSKLTIQPVGLRWECHIGKINSQLFESNFPGCLPPKVTPYSHLMEMVSYNIPSEVKKTVSKGADVNKILNGRAPLYVAIKNKRRGMVKVLISLGANVDLINNADYGRTPLMYAVLEKHMGIIKVLVKNGANVNAVDSDGESVLEYVEREDDDIEDYLVENGADVKF